LVASTEKERNADSAFPKKRPRVIDADILRFKNNEEEWIAFIGLIDGRPYEIFTGKKEDDNFPIPRSIRTGKIIKTKEESGMTRYDFEYVDKYGYKVTMGGLSHQFYKEFWNYAKLISGVLRHGMPVVHTVDLVTSLRLDDDNINNWVAGVARALKKYIPDGTEVKGKACEDCGSGSLIYQEGCLMCTDCGSSKCG